MSTFLTTIQILVQYSKPENIFSGNVRAPFNYLSIKQADKPMLFQTPSIFAYFSYNLDKSKKHEWYNIVSSDGPNQGVNNINDKQR